MTKQLQVQEILKHLRKDNLPKNKKKTITKIKIKMVDKGVDQK